MSGHGPLSKHERQIGYLKMTISLQLGPDRDVVDDTLHPMNGIESMIDWSGAVTEFINELGH